MLGNDYVILIPCEDPLSADAENIGVPLKFHIAATSKVDAYVKLLQVVHIGSPFQDYGGNTPNPLWKCTSINIVPVDQELHVADAHFVNGMWTGGWYLGTCNYKYLPNEMGNNKSRNGIELVPGGPAVWYTEQSVQDKPTDTDRKGNPIVNTAGIPIEAQTQVPWPSECSVAEWIVMNTKWVDAVRFSRRFLGKINSKVFLGANPETLLGFGLAPEALTGDVFGPGGNVKYRFKMEWHPDRIVRYGGEDVVVKGYQVAYPNLSRVKVNLDYDPDLDEDDPLFPLLGSPYLPILMPDPDPDRKAAGKMIQVTDPVFLQDDGDVDPNNTPNFVVFDLVEAVDFNDIKIPGSQDGIPNVSITRNPNYG